MPEVNFEFADKSEIPQYTKTKRHVPTQLENINYMIAKLDKNVDKYQKKVNKIKLLKPTESRKDQCQELQHQIDTDLGLINQLKLDAKNAD